MNRIKEDNHDHNSNKEGLKKNEGDIRKMFWPSPGRAMNKFRAREREDVRNRIDMLKESGVASDGFRDE